MKKLLALIAVAIVIFFTACDDNLKSKEQQALKVGMELAYPPFEMSDKDGKPSGISVDLAYALGKHLDREVIIENISWDRLIPSLKKGKVDIIISSMTITKERKKTIDFSIPYTQSSLAILANINSNISTIDDLNKKNKTVAVKKGSTGHIYAKDNLTNANILVFDQENLSVSKVVQGEADAFLYDQLTIYKNWSNHPKTTKAILPSFQRDFEYWGIALRQNEPKLKSEVNAFIKKAKEDKFFDNLSYKYLKDIRVTFDTLGIPFFF